jgi:cation diffusion facilitator CzcD-associated flavoprotein CzcO
MKYIKFQHRVIGARWSESEKGWHVKIENQVEGTVVDDFCHVLLNCNGVLKYEHSLDFTPAANILF